MQQQRSNWKSRLGFILASAGAAVGLGAIWKFPYLAGSNGGSVFMFPYIIISFTIGLALLIAEIAIGRTGKGDIVTAYGRIGGKGWAIWGYIGVLTGFCVLCFYSAIGGWTLSYTVDAFLGNGLVTNQDELNAHFGALVSNPYIAIGYQALFLFLTAWVVAYDISKGIERISKVLMPLLLVLVLIVIARGVTIPGAEKGLEYLFSWSPEAFSWEGLLAAMGFTFFSLCVGCGCMLTYGSYLAKDSNLLSGCAWITFLATLASILGGLMIMPAVFAFGLEPTAGPGLTFVTMPAVFAHMPFGTFFALLFYICLIVAAITSSVSIFEAVVAAMGDLHVSRRTAVPVAFISIMVIGVFCTMSFGPLADFKIFGKTVFDLLDYLTSNVGMPLTALGLALVAAWVNWPETRKQLTVSCPLSNTMLTVIRLGIGIISPIVIITVVARSI